MSRRLFLSFVVLLCLGLSLPALAEPGQGGGPDAGQGGGPPTTVPSSGNGQGNGQGGPPTTVTAPGNGQGGPPTTVTAPGNSQGNGNGQGGPSSTVTTASSNGNGNGNSNSNSNSNGNSSTTITTHASGSGQGNGQGIPSTTVTTHASGNGNGNGEGNGQNNGTPGQSTTVTADRSTAEGAAFADDAGTKVEDRIAVFLTPLQVPEEADASLDLGVGTAQSAPARMVSWLLSANEQRFLPVVASPLVALLVMGRALASAGSGAVAPVALLVALAVTKLMDLRRGRRPLASPA